MPKKKKMIKDFRIVLHIRIDKNQPPYSAADLNMLNEHLFQ